MKVKVYTLNAFAKSRNGGNPAGVVLNADSLTDRNMQLIAKQVGFSETAFVQRSAFVQKSGKADFKVRFFTPNNEVDLCGHATIATFYLMAKKGIIKAGAYTQETKAGILKVRITDKGLVYMSQNLPQFFEEINKKEIADSLNIPETIISPNLPIQIVSTGFPTIMVPISSLNELKKITPSLDKCVKLCKNKLLIHAFTLETINKNSTAYSRNFFPVKTLDEDSATGTSTGALSCYLFKHGVISKAQAKNMVFEQGYSMNKPSKILISLGIRGNEITSVQVGGSARNIEEKEFEI